MSPDIEELRKWNTQLTLDPLDPGDPDERRYVPLQESGRAAVEEMMATIQLAVDTTTQLLSGPPGAGKTTELYRLRGELAKDGYRAALIDIYQYVNGSSPVDVTDFLIALALGAHDTLGGNDKTQARSGGRLRDMLSRLSIDLDVAGFSAKVSSDRVALGGPGASVGVDLQRELKGSQPFVAQLREKLAYRVGELYDEVAEFLSSSLPDDQGHGVVLIVDGLERLSGTLAEDFLVQASIEAMFVNHASKLKFASHHMVYTVPPSLQFTASGALPYDGRVLPVPVPHVSARPGQSADTVKGALSDLRRVVAARIPTERIFASEEDLDRLIAASGGHLRDLFTLLKALVGLMLRRSISLPVNAEHIEAAIEAVGHDFSAVTEEQERFLRAVAEGNGTVRPDAADIPLMMRLLKSHMLLGHLNGQDWYEVHPLARRALGLTSPGPGPVDRP